MNLNDLSLTVSNFKCFGEPAQGFPRIRPINVIIGRNNTGKSSLLDLVGYAVRPSPLGDRGHRRRKPQTCISWALTAEEVDALSNERVEIRHERNAWQLYPQRWAREFLQGQRITWELAENNSTAFVGIARKDDAADNKAYPRNLQHIRSLLESKQKNPFHSFEFRRISAERNVLPEPSDSTNLHVFADGRGATNLIQRFVTSADLDRDLVEGVLLNEINSIFRPDAEYRHLRVQQYPSSDWEIFLEEATKGRIPLSQTGSGLKTVLLVLLNFLVIPQLHTPPRALSKFIFAFEELENHLHPAIQRRLLRYIRRRAVEDGCYVFVTTHSNVVIDLFSTDHAAQILHVTHNGEVAAVSSVETPAHGYGVLDDLDVRASDLLQTNAVVWVEGPSDRIYFNRWVELWTGGELLEGVHYQCLPYGGSLNKHYSFESPELVDELICALRINRHAILLADSDKRTAEGELKPNLQRLVREMTGSGGYCWVTQGREVENYIPPETLQILLKDDGLKGPAAYSDVLAYIAEKRGNNTPPRKVDLATEVALLLNRDVIANFLDMSHHLDSICRVIRTWNRLESISSHFAT